MQTIRDLKQLLNFFRDNQDGGPKIPKCNEALTDRCGSANVEPPSRLRDNEDLGCLRDFPTNNELLQIASRKASCLCLRSAASDIEVFDRPVSGLSQISTLDEPELSKPPFKGG